MGVCIYPLVNMIHLCGKSQYNKRSIVSVYGIFIVIFVVLEQTGRAAFAANLHNVTNNTIMPV